MTNKEKIQTSNRLQLAWHIEIDKNFKSPAAVAAKAKYMAFNKANYPVIIRQISGVDYHTKQAYSYGEIDFCKAGCGWTDSEIFHYVNEATHRFVPNEIGNKVKIQYSRGGGSAYYEFDYNTKTLAIAKKALVAAGYKVKIEKPVIE